MKTLRLFFLLTYAFFVTTAIADSENYVLIPKNREQKSKFKKTEDGKELSVIHSSVQLSKKYEKKELKILVWNIFKGVKHPLFEKFPMISGNYDMVLLQEAYTTPEMLTMFSKTPFRYTLAGSYIYRPQNVVTGVATGFNVEPLKEVPLRSKYNEPIVDAPQMCLASYYQLSSGKTLLVLNVHAINFVPSEHLFDQLEQLRKHISGHQGPVILAGDFNTWDEKKTKYLKRIAKILSLAPVTFKDDHRKTFRGYPLDHVYFRGLDLITAKTFEMKEYSDHNPIEATFGIPAK